MRWTLPALALLLALAAPAHAQECSEDDPCLVRAVLDASGIWFDAPGHNATTVTQWGWYVLEVRSDFDDDRTMTLDGHGSLVATGYDHDDGPRSTHGPFRFEQAGPTHLRSGDADAVLQVQEADPPAAPDDGGDANETVADNEAPPPGPPRKNVPAPMALPLLAAGAALLRARR